MQYLPPPFFLNLRRDGRNFICGQRVESLDGAPQDIAIASVAFVDAATPALAVSFHPIHPHNLGVIQAQWQSQFLSILETRRARRWIVQHQAYMRHTHFNPQAGFRDGFDRNVWNIPHRLKIRRPNVTIRRFAPALIGAGWIPTCHFPRPGNNGIFVNHPAVWLSISGRGLSSTFPALTRPNRSLTGKLAAARVGL